MPSHAYKAAMKELKRLKKMPAQMPEHAMIRFAVGIFGKKQINWDTNIAMGSAFFNSHQGLFNRGRFSLLITNLAKLFHFTFTPAKNLILFETKICRIYQ